MITRSLKDLSSLDRQVLGFSLEKHHRFFLDLQGAKCFLFQKQDSPEAYAYIQPDGRIGPLAVRSPGSFKRVFDTALEFAASQTEHVGIITAGSNEHALSMAMKCGMRIDGLSLLMASKPFGNWASYPFHSPGLM